MIAPEADWRLREWSRWARQRRWSSSMIGSAESRYRPETGEVWDDDPKPLPPDARDAWYVECEWRFVPLHERMLIRAYYITGPNKGGNAWEAHKRVTCRKLGIHPKTFNAAVDKAVRMLVNRLTRAYGMGSISVQISPRALREHQEAACV
jgi:hypothetical protein